MTQTQITSLKRLGAAATATTLTLLWLYTTRELAHTMFPGPTHTFSSSVLVYVFAGIITLTVGAVWGVLYSIVMGRFHHK